MTNDPKEQTIDWAKLFAQNDNGYTILPDTKTTKINDEKYHHISIGFSFTDAYGNDYSANTKVEVLTAIESEIDVIGQKFNAFLSQCGYVRENQFMLMKDLTEEEVESLTAYLDDIRNKREGVDEK